MKTILTIAGIIVVLVVIGKSVMAPIKKEYPVSGCTKTRSLYASELNCK